MSTILLEKREYILQTTAEIQIDVQLSTVSKMPDRRNPSRVKDSLVRTSLGVQNGTEKIYFKAFRSCRNRAVAQKIVANIFLILFRLQSNADFGPTLAYSLGQNLEYALSLFHAI